MVGAEVRGKASGRHDGAVKSRGVVSSKAVAPSVAKVSSVGEAPTIVTATPVVESLLARLVVCNGELVLGLVTREVKGSSVSGERFRLLDSLLLPGGVEVL